VSVLGILASGRGSNAEAIIRSIEEGRLDASIGLILTDNPDAPVLETASLHAVPARFIDPGRRGARLTPEAEQMYVDALQEAGVQWVCLAGFMRILRKPFLQAFPGHVLNIHPSLLPAFPGLDAQKQAFDYGVRVAGCTVHFVDEGVDSGPVIAQATVPVHDTDTAQTLRSRILEQEHALYPRALEFLLCGRWRLEGRRVLRTT
jgi:phosphoribosylglycinamide formyltransferase-1